MFFQSFPMAANVAKIVFDWDLNENLPQAAGLIKTLAVRPTAIKVAEDAKAGMKEFREHYAVKG